MTNDERTKDVRRDYKAWRLVKWMMVVWFMFSIFLIVTYMSGQLVIFEDGSFILFHITGCLPGAICNIGG